MSINSLYASLRGFSFNNKHNHDMKVIMHNKSIQHPAKKKIKESVPFMNGSYDFSTVGSNGEITYDTRTITIVIGIPMSTKDNLQTAYSKILMWLVDVGKSRLIFDDSKDYFYLAEVESVSTFEEVQSFGKLTATFVADPFKTSINNVGDDIWDTFNFEEDVVQNLDIDVVGSEFISVYNAGRSILPNIVVSADMTLNLNDINYNLVTGDNMFYNLKLLNGENAIVINGTGNIKIIFKKKAL